jgi:large subunit ribosomal protein L15
VLEKIFDDSAVVDMGALIKAGLVNSGDKVKVLAGGAIAKKLTVKAHAFSTKAAELITAAGGVAEVLTPRTKFVKKKK